MSEFTSPTPPQAPQGLHRRQADFTSPTPPQAPQGLHRRQAADRLHVTFVCTGNICRSPMAEKMFAHQISARGLDGVVRVTSAGTAGWHAGSGADERANRVLRKHGYPTEHSAAMLAVDHLNADLVVALARNHVPLIEQLGVDADRIRMLRSFDPRSGAYVHDVDDPYYGSQHDFEVTYSAIEASLPGLHTWVDERLARDGSD